MTMREKNKAYYEKNPFLIVREGPLSMTKPSYIQ